MSWHAFFGALLMIGGILVASTSANVLGVVLLDRRGRGGKGVWWMTPLLLVLTLAGVVILCLGVGVLV